MSFRKNKTHEEKLSFHQPFVLDVTKPSKKILVVEFKVRRHAFASDDKLSSSNPSVNPIFNSDLLVNGKMVSRARFGLPALRQKRSCLVRTLPLVPSFSFIIRQSATTVPASGITIFSVQPIPFGSCFENGFEWRDGIHSYLPRAIKGNLFLDRYLNDLDSLFLPQIKSTASFSIPICSCGGRIRS